MHVPGAPCFAPVCSGYVFLPSHYSNCSSLYPGETDMLLVKLLNICCSKMRRELNCWLENSMTQYRVYLYHVPAVSIQFFISQQHH